MGIWILLVELGDNTATPHELQPATELAGVFMKEVED
jgi:hypothetical protein